MRRTNVAAIALLLGVGVFAAAQAQSNYKAPRTPDGQPDLQGTWSNGTLTPVQRPVELGDKAYYTEQEAADYVRRTLVQGDADRPEARRAGDPGSYNQAFFDRGSSIVKTRRTSLIIDPPNGRVPPMTPQAQAIFDKTFKPFNNMPADKPSDRLLTERCILFGATGPPMFPEPYNNNYQIVQSPGYVTILSEMNHEVRAIPLDGPNPKTKLGEGINQWIGDSHGYWDGETLVVETTNLSHTQVSRFGVGYMNGMSDENLTVTERFTRTDPETIMYQATISDPTVYTKPWTVEIPMVKSTEPIFEYACHEGNYGLFNILSAARAQEKAGPK